MIVSKITFVMKNICFLIIGSPYANKFNKWTKHPYVNRLKSELFLNDSDFIESFKMIVLNVA